MKIYKFAPKFLKNYASVIKSNENNDTYKGLKGIFRFFDMFFCQIRFHVLPEEYDFYKFYNYKNSYRKNFLVKYNQYITYSRINGSIIKRGESRGKDKQYLLFGKDLISRDWILLDDESTKFEKIKEFTQKHKKVVFKPAVGSLGLGVFVYENNDNDEELYKAYEKTIGIKYICEDYIEQNRVLSELHNKSVNTCRIVTFNDNKTIKIISATLKIGASDCVVDNIRHEGLGATIDIDTGIVCTPGYDYKRNKYFYHPESNKKIIGLEIPNWKSVKKTALEGAKKASEVLLIGWDIAVTEDGACIIEMNRTPGTKITQMYDMVPKGKIVFDYIKENKIPPLNRKVKKRLIKAKF